MTFIFFLSGIGAASFALAGLFFLKFWRASHDRFFAFLCSACWLLTVERFIGAVAYIFLPTDEVTVSSTRTWMYLVRLVASALILYAVIQKNREEEH